MRELSATLRGKLLAVVVMIITAIPSISYAETVTERPSGLEMTADLILVRPIMLVTTVVGTGVFVLSLPFTALGRNVGEAAKTLVATPFKGTFKRCLGCSQKHLEQ